MSCSWSSHVQILLQAYPIHNVSSAMLKGLGHQQGMRITNNCQQPLTYYSREERCVTVWPFRNIHRFGVLTEHSNQASYNHRSYEHSNMASSSAEVGSLAVAGPSREEAVSLTQF